MQLDPYCSNEERGYCAERLNCVGKEQTSMMRLPGQHLRKTYLAG